MDTYHVLVFRTDLGELATIRIPYGKKFPTEQELKNAMDKIIETGVVDMLSGNLSGRESAEIVSTNVQEFSLQ